MANIFVSYARKDIEQVQHIMQALSSLGYDYWMDRQKLRGGDLWTKEIPEAIDACVVLLFFMSANSTISDSVRREIHLAFEKKKKILILRLDQAEIPPQLQFVLAGIQWIDLSDDDWKARLVRALGGEFGHQHVTGTETTSQTTATETNYHHDDLSTGLAGPIASSNNVQTGSGNENDTAPTIEEYSEGLRRILQIIERMCYNGDLSTNEGEILKDIFMSVAMNKKKFGEEIMSTSSQEYSGNPFLRSSKTLAYYLLSLSDHHGEWPNVNLSNRTKDESLILLRHVQDEVLTSAALIQQQSKSSESQEISFETERIINSLHSLRLQFVNIDQHLFAGSVPYEVENEIERHFDDLVYYLNKYILILDDLAGTAAGTKMVQ